jgi:hypothetical protein
MVPSRRTRWKMRIRTRCEFQHAYRTVRQTRLKLGAQPSLVPAIPSYPSSAWACTFPKLCFACGSTPDSFPACLAHGLAWACLRTSNGYARARKAVDVAPHLRERADFRSDSLARHFAAASAGGLCASVFFKSAMPSSDPSISPTTFPARLINTRVPYVSMP